MLRKISCCTVSLLFVCAIAASGISAQAKTSGQRNLIIAGSASTGTWFIFASALSQLINKHLPGINASPTPSAGTPENLRNLGSGSVDIALALPDYLHLAYNGEGPFSGPKKMSNLRSFYNTYSFPLHIMVQARSDIKAIKDLKGKKIGTGVPGAGERDLTLRVLEAYGLTEKDVRLSPLSVGERCSALGDGKVDCSFVLTGITSAAIQELTTTKSIRYLSIGADQMNAINKKYPFYTKGSIPANTLKGQSEAVSTVIMWGVLTTTAELDQDLAYNITKLTFENKQELVELNPLSKEISLETATVGLPVPLHPGAEKYYREKGLLK
jgi:TRAP transporter TAXI family solute receptor